MTDSSKFRALIILTTVLCVTVLLFNILQEVYFQDVEGYIKRRLYYERVISKKGLDLHKAMHWKEKD
jgi:hypothetical protein